MAGRLRLAIVGATVIFITQASPAMAGPPAVVVHIDDQAGVEPRQLASAKIEVERIFRSAAVSVTWQEGPLAPAVSADAAAEVRHVAVILLSGQTSSPPATTANECTLGQALQTIGRAYIFYNRVVGESSTRPVDVALVLAHVMAHEIGHLLLPPNSHSRIGIMRSHLDFTLGTPRQFTDEHAAMLRARLSGGPAHH
jgi:hypothetical protein